MNLKCAWGALFSALVMAPAVAQDQKVDTGTDPTKMSSSALVKFEHIDLRGGFSSGTLRLAVTQPFGPGDRYALTLKVPVASIDVPGNDGYGLGDASVQVAHVFGLSQTGGYVVQGELIFDTASRAELGTGKQVFKGTLIAARFLNGGAIFAPAWVQSNSLGGESGRSRVNATTLDFYYVPKMEDARNMVTYDPALNFDWENNTRFASLAVTLGRVIGPAFGGNAILQVKPTIFAGGDRPGKWGLEAIYKVIGF